MMSAEFLVNAYIDANILLALAVLTMLLGRALMTWAGFGTAFRAQLTLVTGVLVTLALVPVISFGSSFVSQLALPRASDFLVSQFLNGRIDMSATDFGQMLGLRDRFVAEVVSPSNAVSWALLALALSVAAGLAFQVLRNISRLRAVLGTAYTIRRHGRIRIMSADSISVPFTARGLWAYYVVVPARMLADNAEAKIAIGHELQHIRQGDAEWEIAIEVLRPLLFWNPAYWAIRSQLRALREYACDQEFLARSRLDRRSYGTCLIDVAERAIAQREQTATGAFSVPLIETAAILRTTGSSSLGRRIHALTRAASRRPSLVLVYCLILPLSFALVFASQSIQPPQGWSHDRIMLTTVINLERVHSLNAANSAFAAPFATPN